MSRAGLVVARHKRHVTVESDGERYLCRTAKRAMQPLIGDEVDWIEEPDGTGIVTKLHQRRSRLSRVDSRGRCELVAANLTKLFAVAAPVPAPDWLVVDHYLVAAELERLSGAVVLNKTDLEAGEPVKPRAPAHEREPARLGEAARPRDPAHPGQAAHLECYRRAGYAVLRTSTAAGTGLGVLANAMAGERSVMVGQSGVGKSSLLNALLGDAVQNIGELTGKGAQGRHTTSSAILHRLPNGGELIDAPGVRAYAPYIEDAVVLQHGFREFREHLGECRFDNCRHLAEPGCAIKTAVERDEICRQRYESYERLYALIQSLKAKRES